MLEKYSKNLIYFIITGSLMGVLLGIFAPEYGMKTEIVGKLFLNALFMLVVPLIMASMIAGIASLGNVKKLGGQGFRTLIYYMVTTCLSVLTGLILVNIVKPGSGIERPKDIFPNAEYTITARPISGGSVLRLTSEDKFSGTSYGKGYVVELMGNQKGVYGVIDTEALMEEKAVVLTKWVGTSGKSIEPVSSGIGVQIVRKAKPFKIRDLLLTMIPKNLIRAMVEVQVLALIIFSLVFGGVLTTLGDRGKPVIDFFVGFNAAIMKMVHLLMLTAPIGIFALVAHRLGLAQLTMEGGFVGELSRLGKYAMTVILGLAIHGFITLPLLLRFIGQRSPLTFARNMGTPLITAFSTASSAATLPLTMKYVVEQNDVKQRTASFVLPIGATINMDGTAMYEAVAALFIAQVYGIDLTVSQQILVFITSVLAGVGAAAIPEAGLVTMVLVLTSVGLPTEGIAILLAIDWFLDRCRTTVNVWGDAVGAGILDRFEKDSTSDITE